jgi:hypothetical protein
MDWLPERHPGWGHRRSSKDPRPMGSLWPGSERIMKANVDIGRTPASGTHAD